MFLIDIGHSQLFKKAKELGTYLIVGVHEDKDINECKGRNYPIMNINERVFGVLSCRYVDDVIIGAPWTVTREMIETYHIKYVVHGKFPVKTIPGKAEDPYKDAKEMGVYVELDSGEAITTTEIVDRVNKRHADFELRNKKKGAH